MISSPRNPTVRVAIGGGGVGKGNLAIWSTTLTEQIAKHGRRLRGQSVYVARDGGKKLLGGTGAHRRHRRLSDFRVGRRLMVTVVDWGTERAVVGTVVGAPFALFAQRRGGFA